jgi:membrane-associated progesterone receptor component
MYGNFAGRDASRGMAKQSFDIGKCTPWTFIPVVRLITSLFTEMLTPIDQPLDKLMDLKPDEMYDCLHTLVNLGTDASFVSSENMKGDERPHFYLCITLNCVGTGWIDHFSNKYIICGKLVENGAA